MKSRLFHLVLFSFTFLSNLPAQQILVQPYLQDASPTSIHILWETDGGQESLVEWGMTPDLGNTTSGSYFLNKDSNRIHMVKLEGLSRFTNYYYRVRTGSASSEIYQFKTPPFASGNESFRLAAISDMQRDGNNPDKFMEVAQEGIMTYLEEQHGGNLPDNLGLIIIPGDLVENGNNYESWKNEFFNPAGTLFSHVPVYPALGNHENNSIYYFNYFHLPENGTAGFEEHWWYKDYSNTRIIGLNSNAPFTSQEQLNWLDTLLEQTCMNDSIDFVFAQLHHPHKSELWLPGESNFTGQVVSRLEQFSTDCQKPSIHFFGHTHGYSRGQSRDHKHLWINVATAGGAIDHWGEYPQFDYDEFTRSQDEWGFVLVDVEAGDDPSFTVKRISRGNESIFRDNEVTDSFTVRLHSEAPSQPIAVFPVDETVSPHCVVLKANNYNEQATSGGHGASHWQVSMNCDDFSSPVKESWKNFENWYFNTNTQAGDDMTDEKVIDLDENTSYCWRVRYRDKELNWSDWSEPVSFTTGASQHSPNLLINPGAEAGIGGWTALEGALESLTDGECNGISPHSGDKYFAVGGVCEDGPYGKSVQLVNVLQYANDIDSGALQVNYGGFLSNYNGSDLPEMRLYFLDENLLPLDSTMVISTRNSSWTMFSEWSDIPVATRAIQFAIMGTRNAGNDNDSYFDDLFLRVGQEMGDCDEYVVSIQQPPGSIQTLAVMPNPFSHSVMIFYETENFTDLHLEVINVWGQRMPVTIAAQPNKIILKRDSLRPGLYFFNLYEGKELKGRGKFVVE